MNSNVRAELAECPVLMLAGGFGTRLRPMYDDGPKVLAPINDRPFLWYLLAALANSGFRRVVLCVGYRSDQIQRWLGNGSQFGLAVDYSQEPEPMAQPR